MYAMKCNCFVVYFRQNSAKLGVNKRKKGEDFVNVCFSLDKYLKRKAEYGKINQQKLKKTQRKGFEISFNRL